MDFRKHGAGNTGPGPQPPIGRTRAVELAQIEATKQGVEASPGGLVYADQAGYYAVGFFSPGGDHGESPLGTPWIFVDARDGRLIGAKLPGHGSAGEVFMQAQFALHSGRFFGLAGRIGVSLLGAVVAILSLTGVLLWLRKRVGKRRAVAADPQRSVQASFSHLSD